MVTISRDILNDFNQVNSREWLETNGLGGWAGSTLSGMHTRRYHSLLMAATNPPTERVSLLSKLDETLVVGSNRIELSTTDYGDVVCGHGYKHLTSFQKKIFPEWVFEVGEIKLKKTVAMSYGANTTLISYEVIEADQLFQMELLPLVAMRGYHALTQHNEHINSDANFSNHTLEIKAYDHVPSLFIQVPGATFNASPNWYYHLHYAVEQYRGMEDQEDLFSYGYFTVTLTKGSKIVIVVSTDDCSEADGKAIMQEEIQRRKKLVGKDTEVLASGLLTLAADQFIVTRGEDLKTVIAGYHWFTDWGRDTMISLPGLCLSTGRYEEAKKILQAFAGHVSMGMLPNRFQDNGAPPEYNNVDGTLWFFNAVYLYLEATNDKQFVLKEIFPVLTEIIDWHYKGTRYQIKVDADGLLSAGEEGQQLTWMDARIGSWVVTPRMGKPVEIQALWYNALRIYSELAILNRKKKTADNYNHKAALLKEQFLLKFWNESKACLNDVIDQDGTVNEDVRPNQILALSLPFPLIEGQYAVNVLNLVEAELYTPMGLRSLDLHNRAYTPHYGGDMVKRDSAYHQGTIWSWLLGPYIDAMMQHLEKDFATQKSKQCIQNFIYHFGESCIGSVSEIFDAEFPHTPRGCIAQAWGVAELLRVIKKYKLDVRL